MLEEFVLAKFVIDLILVDRLLLPPFKGSSIRGALAMQFKRTVCVHPHVKTCEGCYRELDCPYAYIFETPAQPDQKGVTGYTKFPRPFVVEPPLDTKQDYAPGEILAASLILIGKAIPYLPYFVVALRDLGRTGIGKTGSPFNLGKIHAVNDLTGESEVVYNPQDSLVKQPTVTVSFQEALKHSEKLAGRRVTVKFLTCTQLKYNGEIVFWPEFHILMRNLLRRLSLLSAGHCNRWPDIDYSGMHTKAENVRVVAANIKRVQWEHVSSRQGRRVPHEGITGEVTYEGNLEEFLPYLVIGTFTHVGDSTVFGMGKYDILPSS